MTTFSKALRISVAAALLLAGVTTVAQGQVPGGGGFGLGSGGRGMLQIKGSVVCAGCSLEEARHAQPQERKLYQLSHKYGQVVMKITKVNNDSMFSAIAWPPRLWVRATDSVLQQLGAEENLFKEMEITGILNSTRTLDIATVTISG